MINIRSIQHYMYCPRRFGLLEINNDWAENVFVVKANLMHERVHSGEHELKTKNKTELSSISVYNDELELYGVTDCIEFVKNRNGVYIEQLDENCEINIIEYKPSMPKDGRISETDAIQIFAQKLCADYIWKCESNGYIYYNDVRRRVKLPFKEEYDKYYRLLIRLTGEMRICLESGEIPKRVKGQKCSGCSIKDVCMPQNKKYNVRELIKGGDDICESF